MQSEIFIYVKSKSGSVYKKKKVNQAHMKSKQTDLTLLK